MSKPWLVCKGCLDRWYYGEEATCSHAVNLLDQRGPRQKTGKCAECSKEALLHCVGSRSEPRAPQG